MKWYILALVLVFQTAYAKECRKKPIRIAIVDTGMGYLGLGKEATLCPTGHRDFSIDHRNYEVGKNQIPLDVHGHGTNIAGIIDKAMKASKKPFCLIIVKFYSAKSEDNDNLVSSLLSLQYLSKLKPDIVNFSGGGYFFMMSERNAVKKYLDGGGKMVAAAGNDKSDLDILPFYPAMYDKRIEVVGSLLNTHLTKSETILRNIPSDRLMPIPGSDEYMVRSWFSNYGNPITRWELGEGIRGFEVTLSGTSQATAVATGKIAQTIKTGCEKQ